MSMELLQKLYENCKNNPPPMDWVWEVDNGEAYTSFKNCKWCLTICLANPDWWHWEVNVAIPQAASWNPILYKENRIIAQGRASTQEEAMLLAEKACKKCYEIELNSRLVTLEKAKNKK